MYWLIEFMSCGFVLVSTLFSCCRRKNIDRLDPKHLVHNTEKKKSPKLRVTNAMDDLMEEKTQSVVSPALSKKSSRRSRKEVSDKSMILPAVSTMQVEKSVRTALKNIPKHNFRTIDKEAFLKMFYECEERDVSEFEELNRQKQLKNKVVRINENRVEVYETKEEPTIETETTQSSHHSVRNTQQ